MLRSEISKQLKKEIVEARTDGSTMGIARVRGKMEIYYEYKAITIYEFNELLDIAIEAVNQLIEKGAKPYIFI